MSYANLRDNAAFYARLFMIVEVVLVFAGFMLSQWVNYGDSVVLPEVTLTTAVTMLVFHVVYQLAGLYEAWRGMGMWTELRRIATCWAIIVALVGLFAFVSKTGAVVSRLWFGWGVVFASVAVIAFRMGARQLLARARSRGLNFRAVVLVGAGNATCDVITRLRVNRWTGLEPVKVFDDARSLQGAKLEGIEVGGKIADVYEYIEAQRRRGRPIDQVWISASDGLISAEHMEKLLEQLENTSVDVRLVPNLFGLPLSRTSVTEVAGMPLFNLSSVRKDSVGDAAKNLLDKTVALAVLVLFAPLYLLIAIAVRLDSPGPVLFRQARYGTDGREITVFKFRTMRVMEDGRGAGEVRQAARNDDRVTRVGRFLRKTSLDEMPQFWHVLTGEMSVVGPRPHAVSHNEQYRKLIRGYMGRHKIKPGITGWAQVNGARGATETIEDMRRRVRYDIEYIDNWSLWFDLKIIGLTLIRGFVNPNAY